MDNLAGLSDAARDALSRRESTEMDDRGFVELSRLLVEGVPLARRGNAALGEPAWFVTIYGLGLWLEASGREQGRRAEPPLAA
jgi:hypothetical protein